MGGKIDSLFIGKKVTFKLDTTSNNGSEASPFRGSVQPLFVHAIMNIIKYIAQNGKGGVRVQVCYAMMAQLLRFVDDEASNGKTERQIPNKADPLLV